MEKYCYNVILLILCFSFSLALTNYGEHSQYQLLQQDIICQPTCDSLVELEDVICFDKSSHEISLCKKGYLWSLNNECVLPEDCPLSKFMKPCRQNEVLIDADMICHYKCPTSNGIDVVNCEKNYESSEKCACADGFVLDAQDNCVLREDCYKYKGVEGQIDTRLTRDLRKNLCPELPCGSKQVPNNRKHTCPLTCDMYLNNTSLDDCAFDCGPDFCSCKKGYVLDNTGECVSPEECVGHVECNEEEGEIWTNCGTNCEETCEVYGGFVDPPVCNFRCIPNTCVCRSDHVRDLNGKCVPREQCIIKATCGTNEQWTSCGTVCPQTCAKELGIEPDEGICIEMCLYNTCECNPGFVLTTNDTCVKPSQCSEAVSCGLNEEWTNCGPQTEKTCDNTNDSQYYEMMSECKRNTCVCIDGFVRDSNGQCIPESLCPVECGEHEIKTDCGYCDSTCRTSLGLELPMMCTLECRLNTCVCENGYVRDDNGNCVLLSECPQALKCKKNETWTNCGKSEVETCHTVSGNKIFVEADACVLNTCECKSGFVRNDWGTCVAKSECNTLCGQNEEWTDCGSACPETCAVALGVEEPPICIMQCITNTCQCKAGYARDASGTCVALKDCPQAVTCCGNQTFTNCATKDDDYCDQFTRQVTLGKTYSDGICKKNTCKCLEGLVRNSAGDCVKPSMCESQFVCGKNEIGIFIIDGISSHGGNYTCHCRSGYIRNAQGNCVEPRQNVLQIRPIGFQSKPNCQTNPSACAPIERCLENEYLVHCGKNCYDTCTTLLGLEAPTICDGKCYESACECQPGFVRLSKTSRSCVMVDACQKYFPVTHVTHFYQV